MRLLLTGGRGMLARTLKKTLSMSGRHEIFAPDVNELDITDAAQVSRAFADFRPEAVLHCAAYTAVDRAEGDVEAAFSINNQGSIFIASACKQSGARLIAFSTDYVFNGDKSGPYTEFDMPEGGVNVYGRSKWAGECGMRLHCPNHVIIRTAWLYGPDGPSFVHTMLRLHAQDRPLIRVVNDQLGCPTSTPALAAATAEILERPELTGTFHRACEGQASWYEFAREIFALARVEQRVEPCTTAEYGAKAPRPACSVLKSLRGSQAGLAPMPDWRAALRTFLAVELPRLYPEGIKA